MGEPGPSRPGTTVGGVLLLLLAGVGALVWSRRRVRLQKQIKIVETASLSCSSVGAWLNLAAGTCARAWRAILFLPLIPLFLQPRMRRSDPHTLR